MMEYNKSECTTKSKKIIKIEEYYFTPLIKHFIFTYIIIEHLYIDIHSFPIVEEEVQGVHKGRGRSHWEKSPTT